MDVSPKLLREVEFREQWRGYNPDEVDELLERVAAVLEELHAELHAARERADEAERGASSANAFDEQLKRTLVLAQRTADALLSEAREEAATLLADAERRAHVLTTEAEAHAHALTISAEAHAREVTAAADAHAREVTTAADAHAHEVTVAADARAEQAAAEAEQRACEVERATRVQLRNEVEALERARVVLGADVDALEEFLAAERQRVVGEIEEQLEWLRAPGRLVLHEAPSRRDVVVPAPVLPTIPAPELRNGTTTGRDTSADDASTADGDDPRAGATGAPSSDEGISAESPVPDAHDDDELVAAADENDVVADEPEPELAGSHAPSDEAEAVPTGGADPVYEWSDETLRWASDAPAAWSDEDDAGEPTGEHAAVDVGAEADDDDVDLDLRAPTAIGDEGVDDDAVPSPFGSAPAGRSGGLFDDAAADDLRELDDDGDDFMAELRRAVNDPEPLGPRDHVPDLDNGERDEHDLYDDDLTSSGRFRLRRRR